MKLFNTVFIAISLTSILSCSTNISNKNTYPTIQQECEQSGNDNSLQCQIYKNPDWSQDEKEFQIGAMYFIGHQDATKNCEKSKYWLNKSAKANNGKAINYLGAYYATGCRTPVTLKNGINVQTFEIDYKKAEQYYLLAIKRGNRQAKANLAKLYLEGGYGVEQDYEKAIQLYKKAIEEVPARAYDGLSLAYINQQKYKQALPYLKKGAEVGSANAQNNLGYLYEKGFNTVEINIDQAIYWYNKSAEQGYELAKNNLARLQADLDTNKWQETATHNPYLAD